MKSIKWNVMNPLHKYCHDLTFPSKVKLHNGMAMIIMIDDMYVKNKFSQVCIENEVP